MANSRFASNKRFRSLRCLFRTRAGTIMVGLYLYFFPICLIPKTALFILFPKMSNRLTSIPMRRIRPTGPLVLITKPRYFQISPFFRTVLLLCESLSIKRLFSCTRYSLRSSAIPTTMEYGSFANVFVYCNAKNPALMNDSGRSIQFCHEFATVRKHLISWHTLSICSCLSSGNIGKETNCSAHFSTIGKLPFLWPKNL